MGGGGVYGIGAGAGGVAAGGERARGRVARVGGGESPLWHGGGCRGGRGVRPPDFPENFLSNFEAKVVAKGVSHHKG